MTVRSHHTKPCWLVLEVGGGREDSPGGGDWRVGYRMVRGWKESHCSVLTNYCEAEADLPDCWMGSKKEIKDLP